MNNEILINIMNFIGETVAGDLTAAIIGFLIADRLKQWLQNRQHGGWQVYITRDNGQRLATYGVNATRQMEIEEDLVERDIFIKGRISPHKWLSCDVADVLTINKQKKLYIVDLDQDKKKKKQPWRIVSRTDSSEIEWASIEKQTITLDLTVEPWLTIINRQSKIDNRKSL